MTVTNTVLRNDYVGNGTETDYDFTFIVLREVGNIYTVKVIVADLLGVETVKVQGVDYTVTLGSNGLGSITFTTAPALNHKITLLSDVPNTQETDYINSGTDKFPGASHEAALDKLTLIAKQNKELFNRSVLLPPTSNLSQISLPISIANADNVIVVNSAGDNLEAKSLIDINLAPVSNYMKTLLDDTTESEAQTTLGISAYIKTLLNDPDAATAKATLEIESPNSILPIGSLIHWSTSTAPSNYLECDGAAISRTTYASLFAVISTTFGTGDGSTTFNLPDARGRFLRGWANAGSIDSGRTFGTTQQDAFQGHLHGRGETTLQNLIGGGSGAFVRLNFQGTSNTDGPVSDGANGTPRTAAETRPDNLAVMVCIKYQ